METQNNVTKDVPQIKDIKIGELFTIEGKKYIVALPKNDNHVEMANEHGHIICPIFDMYTS